MLGLLAASDTMNQGGCILVTPDSYIEINDWFAYALDGGRWVVTHNAELFEYNNGAWLERGKIK